MKKYLSILCLSAMLACFVSCGVDQSDNLESSDSTSESTTEEITETTTKETTTDTTTISTTSETTTTDNATAATTETTTQIIEATIPVYVDLNDTYENDFFTMSVSSEWDSWEEYNDYMSFEISPNVILNTWQAETDLRYDNNKDFAEYWVNDGNSDSRISYTFEVCVFDENYFAKCNRDDCISYVCQNGEYIDFFDFYFNDELSEDEEEIMSEILSSVYLKYMNESDDNEATTEEITAQTETTTEAITTIEEVITQAPVVKSDSRTVYYTETGSKYHYDEKCGRGTYFPCTLDEAIDMGLEPCKKCT